ncbi:MAG: hypothetical protein KDD60_13070, partial [Bdellovibrionales bacterium]|nr:hypothetical protein [Bdellovibrionales bacterium]
MGTIGESNRDSFASDNGSTPSADGGDQDSTPGEMGNLGDPLAGLKICSALDFQGVNWPDVLKISERSAIGLGLNITGSFEGTVGWANLANNFDGQGMSLGLLQQNLGQGSLQPLLMSMRQNYPEVLDQEFSLEQKSSLFTMLREWSDQGQSFLVSSHWSGSASLWAQELSVLDTVSESPSVSFLSSSGLDSSFNFLLALLPKNKSSVDWAVSNIYSRDKNFKPEWKDSFQGMAETPEYVSEQIGAALYLHERAQSYLSELSFKELRSYLFFFDIAVQNGGIPLDD